MVSRMTQNNNIVNKPFTIEIYPGFSLKYQILSGYSIKEIYDENKINLGLKLYDFSDKFFYSVVRATPKGLWLLEQTSSATKTEVLADIDSSIDSINVKYNIKHESCIEYVMCILNRNEQVYNNYKELFTIYELYEIRNLLLQYWKNEALMKNHIQSYKKLEKQF